MAAPKVRGMSLCEIKVEVPPSAVDAIDDLLLERGEQAWSLLQDVIVGRAWIVGVFPDESGARQAWSELQPNVPADPLGEVSVRTLALEDWRDSYKAHFKAWRSGRLHWVPVWEKDQYTLPEGDVAIWLDPGLAFGTGNHETTRLCCERLVAFAADRGTSGRVIDAGCGSGILALSASRLGFREVVAFDNDPEAVRVSRENAGLNDLSECVEFFQGDLVSGLTGRQAELVMANIQADVLMQFAPELIQAVAPGGSLVLSGILAVELERVSGAYASLVPGWTRETRIMGEWSDAVFRRG